MDRTGIKVFAPASVGNAAVGFDTLGFALEKPGDEIIVRFRDKPGLEITRITGAKGKLPYDPEKNTAGVAALRTLEHIGEAGRGIEMEIHKKMPFGSGLGSSAASAVAGAMAINELFHKRVTKRELLPFAMQGEQIASGGYHADNVAPSMLGGMIMVCDNATLDVHRLPLIHGLYATVIHPHIEILTKDARSVLSDTIPLKKHIEQSSNLAGWLIGMFRGDVDLLQKYLKDVIIEPQRAPLIPHFYEAKEAAMNIGAMGCSISGAGPSIFALSKNSLIAEDIGEAFKKVYANAKIKHTVYFSPINHEGAILC